MKIYVKVTDDKNQTYEGIAELQKTKKQNKQRESNITINGPTDIVNILYFERYFEVARTLSDVENKIKSKKYNFDAPAIVLALKRSKFLKRKGKRGSYSYIQKTPPS